MFHPSGQQSILTQRHRTTVEQQEINQILSPQKIHSSTVSLELYALITVTFICKDQEDHLGGKKQCMREEICSST